MVGHNHHHFHCGFGWSFQNRKHFLLDLFVLFDWMCEWFFFGALELFSSRLFIISNYNKIIQKMFFFICIRPVSRSVLPIDLGLLAFGSFERNVLSFSFDDAQQFFIFFCWQCNVEVLHTMVFLLLSNGSISSHSFDLQSKMLMDIKRLIKFRICKDFIK